MRLFIILALLALPISLGQFYSTDSYAYTGKIVPQESLFEETVLHNRLDSTKVAYANKGLHSMKSLAKQEESKLTEKVTDSAVHPKQVNIIEGKKNSQGMQLLSVLLMLKDAKR